SRTAAPSSAAHHVPDPFRARRESAPALQRSGHADDHLLHRRRQRRGTGRRPLARRSPTQQRSKLDCLSMSDLGVVDIATSAALAQERRASGSAIHTRQLLGTLAATLVGATAVIAAVLTGPTIGSI